MWGSHSVSKEGHFWERIKWDTKIKSPLKPFSLLVGQGELNSVLQADVCLRSYVRRVSHPLSHIWLFAIPWTITCQAPLSMGSSRQEYWSGLPFPSPILTLGTITKCTCPSVLGGVVLITLQLGDVEAVASRCVLSPWKLHFVVTWYQAGGQRLWWQSPGWV